MRRAVFTSLPLDGTTARAPADETIATRLALTRFVVDKVLGLPA
jgi:hypothetical protein